MTVVYTHEVATGKGFGNFGRLLLRWKGSIYKLLLPDLILYMFLYFSISLLYRLIFIPFYLPGRIVFEKLVQYCSVTAGVIPVSFVLGFYVSQIVTRWWSQFMTIPWPDAFSISIATAIHGRDERSRLLRRTILRYLNLSFVMVMVMISPQAKSRFPTLDHYVEAGIMLPHEKVIMEELNKKSDYAKYFVPIVWAGTLVAKARKEKRIADDMTMTLIIHYLCKWRNGLGDLLGYDWVCIPIVYTQVVTLAVYLYFIAALVGKQFVENENDLVGTGESDLFVPIFLFLEFFFYMGWLKVAETMVNPFGEDDDDFEVNWMIDRNLTVSYLIVDEMHSEVPELLKDAYWDEVIPDELPYTETSVRFKTDPPQGSTAMHNVHTHDSSQNIDGGLQGRSSEKMTTSMGGITGTLFGGPRADSPSGTDENDETSFGSKRKSYAHLLEDNDETKS